MLWTGADGLADSQSALDTANALSGAGSSWSLHFYLGDRGVLALQARRAVVAAPAGWPRAEFQGYLLFRRPTYIRLPPYLNVEALRFYVASREEANRALAGTACEMVVGIRCRLNGATVRYYVACDGVRLALPRAEAPPHFLDGYCE
jgi:hypothetical protein